MGEAFKENILTVSRPSGDSWGGARALNSACQRSALGIGNRQTWGARVAGDGATVAVEGLLLCQGNGYLLVPLHCVFVCTSSSAEGAVGVHKGAPPTSLDKVKKEWYIF